VYKTVFANTYSITGCEISEI